MEIEESELIINSRGAIYHLDIRPDEIADTIITVGDPGRVAEVSKYFDKIECQSSHREFITHTGYIGSKRISVMSTGMGTDNIEIALNELDALVNIDFETRTIKDQHTALKIIRIGTCGALQSDIPVDSFVATSLGLGIDNLMHFYTPPIVQDELEELLAQFVKHTQLPEKITPIINAADANLLNLFGEEFYKGITVTCPGFYAPQGRILRLLPAFPDLIDKLSTFNHHNNRICNFEMETSAIYGLGNLLGHQCLSLSAVMANRVIKQFSSNPKSAIDKLIRQTLETISVT
jgi:uridine phosphorylase